MKKIIPYPISEDYEQMSEDDIKKYRMIVE